MPTSWQRPRETVAAIAGSCAAILEAARELGSARVFVSSSAAMFGDAPESPQREDTWCRPTTPYAIAKLAAHQLVGALRANDGLHVSSGILFNHESERRPEQFVTRRVTRGAAAIALGLQDELALGSLEAVRDWSFAGDIVRGAWLMLAPDEPGDYVLASGVGHTVARARGGRVRVRRPRRRALPARRRGPGKGPGGHAQRGRPRPGPRAAGVAAGAELRAARRAHGARRHGVAALRGRLKGAPSVQGNP